MLTACTHTGFHEKEKARPTPLIGQSWKRIAFQIAELNLEFLISYEQAKRLEGLWTFAVKSMPNICPNFNPVVKSLKIRSHFTRNYKRSEGLKLGGFCWGPKNPAVLVELIKQAG
jgi:hypothetical protein